ncbi:MAG: CopG family transcriptional regulator [Patescibacteria group bacterium]
MTRTQIYLPEEMHQRLLFLAKSENVSLSELIRKGAGLVIKTKQKGLPPYRQTLKMLADYPNSLRVTLADSATKLIRDQRD